jgi:hypothetical protein
MRHNVAQTGYAVNGTMKIGLEPDDQVWPIITTGALLYLLRAKFEAPVTSLYFLYMIIPIEDGLPAMVISSTASNHHQIKRAVI